MSGLSLCDARIGLPIGAEKAKLVSSLSKGSNRPGSQLMTTKIYPFKLEKTVRDESWRYSILSVVKDLSVAK